MVVEYFMRISRLTVDKLGVKLYDRASAVIAELIANAYDADATQVTVRAPMGVYLASRAKGVVSDKGFVIEVSDNGVGMTPQQVQDFFLVVGAERRNDTNRGDLSPKFRRKVMGRKGVGKLAPFGICKTIEVISAGGDLINGTGDDTDSVGYLTSHIILDYNGIMAISDQPDEHYKPTAGNKNNSYSQEPGTQIILKNFNFRKVPDINALDRQLAQRFGIQAEQWQIQLSDSTNSNSELQAVGHFDIDTMPNTKLTFSSVDRKVLNPDGNQEKELTAGFDHNDTFYPVTGWVAYSKAPYKDDLMAGVRIYCRGKIAAQTAIFERRAGFTGEHNVRSYLVGELYADWLDEKEDLIQTDRRDILWSDELAAAFQQWGQKIVRHIGTLSRDPMRKAALTLFLETGNVDDRIKKAYPNEKQQDIRDSAKEFAEILGKTFSRGEAENYETVNGLVELSITLAPHITLDKKMKEAADAANTPLAALSSILRTARLAELSSFGQIAEDRLKVIERLQTLKDADDTGEGDLQRLISDAPWLINPEWAPVTENQAFSSLSKAFKEYYEKKTKQSILLGDFQNKNKRPDFVLLNQEGIVQIIEIKKPDHRLSNAEMDRIVTYYQNMEAFLNDKAHSKFYTHFPDFHVTIVCDELALTGSQLAALEGYLGKGKLTHMDWAAFLLKSQQIHQDFLAEVHRQRAARPAAAENHGQNDPDSN